MNALAAKVWGNLDGETNRQRRYGQGSVIWGTPLNEILTAKNLPPDVNAPDGLDFIHRRVDDTEIYFVSNRRADPVKVNVRFRVGQRIPELWDAVTGQNSTRGRVQR